MEYWAAPLHVQEASILGGSSSVWAPSKELKYTAIRQHYWARWQLQSYVRLQVPYNSNIIEEVTYAGGYW